LLLRNYNNGLNVVKCSLLLSCMMYINVYNIIYIYVCIWAPSCRVLNRRKTNERHVQNIIIIRIVIIIIIKRKKNVVRESCAYFYSNSARMVYGGNTVGPIIRRVGAIYIHNVWTNSLLAIILRPQKRQIVIK
jgi:hypothetical protein